jgi:hypothetical protein
MAATDMQATTKELFCAPLKIFQGAHRSVICTQFSTLPIYTIMYQNCAGDKQKPHKIMRMNMFAIEDKVKPDIENIRGLNLAMVKPTTVQVIKLPL